MTGRVWGLCKEIEGEGRFGKCYRGGSNFSATHPDPSKWTSFYSERGCNIQTVASNSAFSSVFTLELLNLHGFDSNSCRYSDETQVFFLLLEKEVEKENHRKRRIVGYIPESEDLK